MGISKSYLHCTKNGESWYAIHPSLSRSIASSSTPAVRAYTLNTPLIVPLIAKILNIPIYTTTQNAARLGSTVSELKELLPEFHSTEIDKTAFSMLVPELKSLLASQSSTSSASTSNAPVSAIIVGIETHICVTQTALDLMAMGHKAYVLADGVSSCNAGERSVALARLRSEGAVVTTSESLLYEILGDAKDPNFKAIAGLVRDTKESTREAVETFCRL